MEEPPKFIIKTAESPSDLQEIASLFTAYAKALNLDLTFQNFTQELSSLPGKYSLPTGLLLLTISSIDNSSNKTAIGCVALRELDKEKKICEMKRLYCVPETRGMGVGKALVDEALRRARELGYMEVWLDTLPDMVGAQRIYRERGFVEIEAYYDTPLEGTIFLAKKL